MVVKKRGLSKGLDALLTETISTPSVQVSSGFVEINVKRLRPGRFQPRRIIQDNELEQLANSIKEQGLLQPIVVRALGNSGYEIIAGERRWRAAQLASLSTVPVIIKNVSDEAALAIGLIENIQREDLSPLEEAIAFERLGKEFGLSHERIAKSVGKSRTTVTNLLRILTLRADVKVLLERGDIDLGHAKVLLGLQGSQQSVVAREVVLKRLSVRETEQLVSRTLECKNISSSKKTFIDPDIRRLEKKLSEKVGAAVKIVQNSKGKGKMLIKYNSLDELDGILEHMLQELT